MSDTGKIVSLVKALGGGDLPFGTSEGWEYLIKNHVPMVQGQNLYITDSAITSIEEGKTYIVTYGDEDYECTAISGFAFGPLPALALGNMASIGGPDTGEPFGILALPGAIGPNIYGSLLYYTPPQPFSIQHYVEIVTQLPLKFAPPLDWDASKGQPGYIKNRTHYGHYEAGTMVFAGLITLEEVSGAYIAQLENVTFSANAGDTMYTAFASTHYVSTVFSPQSGIIAWGNRALVDGIDNTGEPFCVVYQASQGYCAVYGEGAAEDVNFTFSVSKVVADKQLDPAYIPDNSCFLTSPNGTRYQLTVDDVGTLTATAL